MSPEALTELQRFRFIAQVTYKGRLSTPFALSGVRVEDVLEEPAKKSASKGQTGVAAGGLSVAEVTRHLETLDDRIQAELERQHGDEEAEAQLAGGPEPPPHTQEEDESDR